MAHKKNHGSSCMAVSFIPFSAIYKNSKIRLSISITSFAKERPCTSFFRWQNMTSDKPVIWKRWKDNNDNLRMTVLSDMREYIKYITINVNGQFLLGNCLFNWLNSVRSVIFQHTAGQTHQIDCKTLWNALNLWRGDPSRENTAKNRLCCKMKIKY